MGLRSHFLVILIGSYLFRFRRRRDIEVYASAGPLP